MLSFRNLSLRRGTRLLIQDATLQIHAGEKVGLTGANGCGKSSLFALISGVLEPDTGEFRMPQDWILALVAQETPALDMPAIEYVMDGDEELRRIQSELLAAQGRGEGTREAALHAHLEAIDGYRAEARAARLMNGLGFASRDERKVVAAFSGGWRIRLNLARALMRRSDLLLLDEPTNHLDLDAVIWLETWLKSFPGTLLLISHDRDFLDRVVERIAHIEQQKLTLYAGNYSAFEQQRAAALAQQQAAFDKQQREVEHIQAFVNRFRAKATKARQAQSRLKALERMATIAPAHVDSPFHFGFELPDKIPDPLLDLDGVAAGYGGEPVLSGIVLRVAPGDRIGLLGPNGAGKSTLVKVLAGELEPLAGRLARAADLSTGYFAQHQLEQLDPDATALQHLQRIDSSAGEQPLRDFLGGFGFSGERALATADTYSGGEKARLVLALLVYQRPNLLLLDEPTNHLDLEMRLALNLALQNFSGAVILVSHDRHLLRTVTDSLLLVADGSVGSFDGDVDAYASWLGSRQQREQKAPSSEPPQSAGVRRAQRREEAERRRQLQPLMRRLRQLEASMERLEAEKAAIEGQLAGNEIYQDHRKVQLKELLMDKHRVEKELGETEEAWLELSEKLESGG